MTTAPTVHTAAAVTTPMSELSLILLLLPPPLLGAAVGVGLGAPLGAGEG